MGRDLDEARFDGYWPSIKITEKYVRLSHSMCGAMRSFESFFISINVTDMGKDATFYMYVEKSVQWHETLSRMMDAQYRHLAFNRVLNSLIYLTISK